MSTSDTTEIYELRYRKANLAAAPKPERMFYLLGTGLTNDIQILLRQYIIGLKQSDENKAKRDGSSAVAMLNLRLLAGRFHEGWTLVEKYWPPIASEYEADLSPAGKAALAELKRHFTVAKAKNVVFMIRNKIGFHSEYGFAEKMFDGMPHDTEVVEYIGESFGDTLYFGSEVTHYRALQSITQRDDDVAAFGAIMDELRKLQVHFLHFISAFVSVFARRHLASQFRLRRSRKRTLTALPKFESLTIPFFADFLSAVGGVGSSTPIETGPA